MFGPISLQSTEVIRIAQFAPELLENLPIFLRSLHADFAGEVALQICCHSVVIHQRVVYVEQEDDANRRMTAFVHFSLGPSSVPLIAEMSRVCHAKMQRARKSPPNESPVMAVSDSPIARPIQMIH